MSFTTNKQNLVSTYFKAVILDLRDASFIFDTIGAIQFSNLMIGSNNRNLNKLNISDGNTSVAYGCSSSNAGYSI